MRRYILVQIKMDDKRVIHVWSGPRSLSTATLYSWSQRDDTEVVDEPLYAHYLKQSGCHRPYAHDVFESQSSDGNAVLERLYSSQTKPFLYLKHIAKQRIGVAHSLLFKDCCHHVLLIRDPLPVIQSFSKVVNMVSLEETSYPMLMQLYSEIRMHTGKPPFVVLSHDLASQPKVVLTSLCNRLNIPFHDTMLGWEPGPKPDIDGVWAPYWYQSVWKSTGFTPFPDVHGLIENEAKVVLEECWPMYQYLASKALRPITYNSQTGSKTSGTHVYKQDKRNDDVLVGVRDGISGEFFLVPRCHAMVSVLDSGYLLGDGVWEGIRLHNGRLLFIQEHIDRLYDGAKAIAMENIELTKERLVNMLYAVCRANGMKDGVHIRLMMTRGLKPTPYQNPRITVGRATVVILAEYKEAAEVPTSFGITVSTVHVRRGAPDVQDSKLNSHSKLNCIAACIQANAVGADEGLMLDPHGFVATCNSTNFFIVRKGEVWTATAKYLMPGITRQKIIELCMNNGIPVKELDFSLTSVHSADEAFVTGTFAGQIPVVKIDGRIIGDGTPGPITKALQWLYKELCDRECDIV